MLIRKFRHVLVASIVLFSTSSLAAAGWSDCCSDFSACASDWCSGMDAEVYADFLLWQTGVDGLEFARSEGVGATAETDVATQGGIHNVGCQYDPGLRVGVVLDLCKCDWDFFSDYTYFYERFGNTASTVTESSGVVPPGLIPLIYSNGGLSDLQEATGNWDNRLQVLNAGFGRTFDVCGCFLFRPHLGIKATWQTMKTRIVYDRTANIFTPITRDTLSFRTDFDGVGLRGGFDTAWIFNRCVRLIGNFAMSSVWSDLCQHRQDVRTTVSTDGQVLNPITNLDIKENSCVLIPVMELLIGARFDTCLCCCYPAYVMVGWETQIWFDQNRMILLAEDEDANRIQFGPQGNVHYQGLTVRAGVGF